MNHLTEEIWSQDMANVQLGPEVRVHRMNDPGTYCPMPPIQGEAHWPTPLQSVASKPSSSESPRLPPHRHLMSCLIQCDLHLDVLSDIETNLGMWLFCVIQNTDGGCDH